METRRVDIKLRTFNFALDVLRICKDIAENKKEFVVTKQLSGSATSVGANVREARNAESKKDFIHKISIAQKECDESLYWLELLNEIIEDELSEIKRLRKEAGELLLILSAIILKTKRNLDVSK